MFGGTQANFNGFCVLAALLQRRRSTEANQTLQDVWPSPGLVQYIFIFGGSCPVAEFFQVQNSLCVQVLRSPILAALLHGTRVGASAKLCGVMQTAPPIFGRAAITLGIGPHSSLCSSPLLVLASHVLVILEICLWKMQLNPAGAGRDAKPVRQMAFCA